MAPRGINSPTCPMVSAPALFPRRRAARIPADGAVNAVTFSLLLPCWVSCIERCLSCVCVWEEVKNACWFGGGGTTDDQQNALSIKRVAAKRESKPQYARIQTVKWGCQDGGRAGPLLDPGAASLSHQRAGRGVPPCQLPVASPGDSN